MRQHEGFTLSFWNGLGTAEFKARGGRNHTVKRTRCFGMTGLSCFMNKLSPRGFFLKVTLIYRIPPFFILLDIKENGKMVKS